MFIYIFKIIIIIFSVTFNSVCGDHKYGMHIDIPLPGYRLITLSVKHRSTFTTPKPHPKDITVIRNLTITPNASYFGFYDV